LVKGIFKRNKNKKSLRSFFVFTYLCVSIVPLLVFSGMVFKTAEVYFENEQKKELTSQASMISGHILISGYMYYGERQEEFIDDIYQSSTQGGYRIIVTDATATVVNDSNGTDKGRILLLKNCQPRIRTFHFRHWEKNSSQNCILIPFPKIH